MNIVKVTGIFVSLIGFACAPVASNVPKMSRQTPRTGDTVLVDNEKFSILVDDSVEVVSKDAYEAFEKNLDSDYQLVKFDKNDKKLANLRERLPMNDIAISSKIDHAEILVIFIVDGVAPTKEKAAQIKLAWPRGEKGLLTMSIDEGKTSNETWAKVKRNLNSMVIAYREAKPKK